MKKENKYIMKNIKTNKYISFDINPLNGKLEEIETNDIEHASMYYEEEIIFLKNDTHEIIKYNTELRKLKINKINSNY